MRSYEYIEEEEVPEDILFKIKKVRSLSDEEFSLIHPIWETRPDRMQFRVVNGDDSYEYVIMECDTKMLIDSVEPGNLHKCDFSRAMDNDWWEDERFANTLLRWKDGDGVDPSHVSITNKISITDGRHRAVLAHVLNQKRMKIIVHKSAIQKAVDLLDATMI